MTRNRRHRFFDRVFRGAAGLGVILIIEFWGKKMIKAQLLGLRSVELNYQSLSNFGIWLFAIFFALFLWDINLAWWFKNHGTDLSPKARITFNDYNPKLKRCQRRAGIIFSLLMFFMLKKPTVLLCTIPFSIAVGIFMVYWIQDYDFRTGHRCKTLKTLIRETFSPVWTIWELFSGYILSRPPQQP
jgi:hypothetical protein